MAYHASCPPWRTPTSRAILAFLTVGLLFRPMNAQQSLTSTNFDALQPIVLGRAERYFQNAYVDEAIQAELESMASERQSDSALFSSPSELDVLVPLTNGTADAQVRWTFTPQDNFTIDNYTLVPVLDNANVAADEDVSFFIVEDRRGGVLSYNVTADVEFNKWVGRSQFAISALNATTSEIEATSPSAELLVVGITFFRTDATGNDLLFSDSRHPVSLTSEEIVADPNYNLDVFIQFVDGSSSNTSLTVPLSGLSITTGSLVDQIKYGASCAATAGSFTGSDVELPAECGMGFSTNEVDGLYVGPKFGFDFNKYQNGTFLAFYEWNEILVGSDLEDVGYETFLQVDIVGEVPPVVYAITPSGPFNSIGNGQVKLNVGNLPDTVEEANLWAYALSIDFGSETKDATFEAGSIVVHANNTASYTFTVPAGVGTDLPWTLTVTKPTGEQLVAIDQTEPAYLFNFVVEIVINSITPDSGPEEGGTEVTLVGDFPVLLGGNLSVYIDGSQIDASLINTTEATSITFTMPPKPESSSFAVEVTVVTGNITSNAVTFTYDPAVRLDAMAPESGPAEGGTIVTLQGQFINFDPSAQNSGIFFGGTVISADLIQSYNSSTVVFTTPNKTTLGAADSVYAFNVTVQINGVSSNPLTFTYDAPVIIDAIQPSSGDEAGGTTVVLTGQFVNFNLDTSTVVIGGKVLDAALITSVNETTVEFVTPPLSEIGLAYTQKVQVTIGVLASNEVDFTYLETRPGINIDGGGGDIDPSTGFYRLGACSDGLFRVLVSSGTRARVTSYQWTLTEEGGTANLLSSDLKSDADVILLPYAEIPAQNTPYILTITIATDSGSFSESLTLVQKSVQAVSVYIADPRARSPSDPNVTLTVPSIVGLPGCANPDVIINTTAITYEWVFRETTYVFSYLNKTAPENEISPTLLGREFHIPQQHMEYGSFSLSLTAYFTEQDTIRGSDSTTVVFEPAPLVAQINGGETSQLISETQSFTLSAAQSRDPDILSGNAAAGLEYAWSCQRGFDASLAVSEECDNTLMPSDRVSAMEFTLSAADLAAVQNVTSNVYIEYSLRVSKTSQNATNADISRVSGVVASTLILAQETAQSYEALAEIDVVNNQSTEIDRSSVKYYEDVTITPVSETTETTWTFKLIAPLSQSRTLLFTDDNLLTFPGYYTVGAEAGRYSLGLKANVLSPNTEYQFLISTFRTGFAVNEQVVALTTVEQPTVTVGNLATPTGTTNDTYVLSASTSYDGDFKFFFLLTDDFGFETCVGGCQGTSFIRFRLATAGNYSVRCDVYDSLGFTLLATAQGGNIVVTADGATDADLSIFSADVTDAFLAGDHSDFHQLGTDMVKYVLSNGGSSSSELDSETLRNFTEGLNQVAANSVPNAIQSAGFVRTAAALASLTPELGIVYDTATLYYLLNITINAVDRTPDNAAMQQMQDLLDFYDLTPELVLASYSGGTTRNRLVQQATSIEDEVLGLWLDLYEVMKEQLTFVALTRCSCGCIEEVTTGISSSSRDGLRVRHGSLRADSNLTAAASYVNRNQSEVTRVKMKLAHFCNSEQGIQLSLNEGTDEEVQFSWCKGVYENTIKRLYFALAKTPDYVYLSGLHKNVTLSDGLIGTTVGRLENSTITDAALPIGNCYKVKMPIPREVALVPEGAPADQVPKGLLFAPEKRWGQSVTGNLYWPMFQNISTEIDTTSGASSEVASATLTLTRIGVLAVATEYAWASAGFSLEGILLLALEVAGVTLTILVLILVASLGAWLLATRWFATADIAAPIEIDFTYVERDVYGRGTAIDIAEEREAIAEMRRA